MRGPQLGFERRIAFRIARFAAQMTAAVPILLVSTATRWYGTARTPRALAKAGFEVTLLAPRNSLAESSRFVARMRTCRMTPRR